MTTRPALRASGFLRSATGVVSVLVLGVVALSPVCAVLAGFVARGADPLQWPDATPSSWTLLAWSIGTSCVVGLVAVVLGAPVGWWAARGGAMRWAVALLPVMMPNYLVYAGWSIARDPWSRFGVWLGDQGVEVQTAVSKSMAVVGIAVWMSPIAALCVGIAARGVRAPVYESLLVDGAAWRLRMIETLTMVRGGVVAGWCLCVVIALGSAVPLHVAQMPTVSIDAWLMLDLTPDRRVVWISVLPVLGVVCVLIAAVFLLVRREIDSESGLDRDAGDVVPASSVGASIAPGLVVGLGFVVPLLLFAWSLVARDDTAGPIVIVREVVEASGQFWHDAGRAVGSSVMVALAGGVAISCTAMLVWATFALTRARWIRVTLLASALAMVAWGVAPGILVGVGVQELWGGRGGVFGLVHAVVLRFGMLGVLAGMVLASVDRRRVGAIRAIDRVSGPVAWWRTVDPGLLLVVVGVGGVGAALAFHEIESVVVSTPPGFDPIAKRMLGYLHFSRQRMLSAGAINLSALGGAVGVVSVAAISFGFRLTRSRTRRAA